MLGGFLWPLAIWRLPRIVATDHPLATAFGLDLAGAMRFAVPVLLAFAAFAIGVRCAHRIGGRAAVAVVLGGTVVFSLTLLPINPVGSHDVYHNIADARTLWIYGDNPTIVPPAVYEDDPFFDRVPAWKATPSVYGPVWYALSGLPLPFAGDRLWANVIGQKLLTAAFLLFTAALAMATAARIHPGSAVAAGVLVGWNPLLQFETAGNAHNSVVMACFAVAALYALTRRWWTAVFPLLALAVASNYVFALLCPLVLIWMVRREHVPRLQVTLSLVLGLLVGAALYLPFYAGTDSLNAFLREAGYVSASPGAALHSLLWWWLRWNGNDVLRIVKLILLPPYVIAYAVLLQRAARDARVAGLVQTGFAAVFLLLVLGAMWFGPWYVMFVAPLGALLPGRAPALITVAFSASAMLMYVPWFWLQHGDPVLLQTASATTAFLLPMLIAAVALRRRLRRDERGGIFAEIGAH